tara:strand:+ start:715 stop:1365 length:651 start_codon:yes stop_codon:yes gene_type:complete
MPKKKIAPKKITSLLSLLTQSLCLALLLSVVCEISLVQADSSDSSNDEIFGGQILSLTEEKPELKPSNDPRFKDNNDGTVTDLQEGLMWKKIDLYQEKKIWSSWEESQKLIESFNEQGYAKYSDWRLPTRKELKSLYEEDKNVPWKYYWTENVIHIDPIFGYSHCCFWSSELYKDKYAWGFNYIGGKDYPSMKGGGQYHLSLSTIRPVRSVMDKDS